MRKQDLKTICSIAIFAVVLFYASSIQAALLEKGFIDAVCEGEKTCIAYDLDEENAGWLLSFPFMPALVAISNDLRWQSSKHWIANRAWYHERINRYATQPWEPYKQLPRGVIPDDALMLAGGLGQFYYMPDLRALDNFGLTDHTVARTPSTRSNRSRLVAHDRNAPREYVAARGVNFNVHFSVPSAGKALGSTDYALKVGPDLWMPFDAVNGLWVNERFSEVEIAAFVREIEARLVKYDDGITLFGFAFGHRNEYLSSSPVLLLNHARSIRGVMRWQVEHDLEIEFVQSLRFYNAEGERVHQFEGVIRHPVTGYTTRYWLPKLPTDSKVKFEIPDDLPAGEYELRLVVYNLENKDPTVEIDVWVDETTLARVRISN